MAPDEGGPKSNQNTKQFETQEREVIIYSFCSLKINTGTSYSKQFFYSFVLHFVENFFG
jgi:hypothetical protein